MVWHILTAIWRSKRSTLLVNFPCTSKNTQKSKNILRSPYHKHQWTRETGGDESAVIIIQLFQTKIPTRTDDFGSISDSDAKHWKNTDAGHFKIQTSDKGTPLVGPQPSTVEPPTPLRTPTSYGHPDVMDSLSQQIKSSYIFSKINTLNMGTA